MHCDNRVEPKRAKAQWQALYDIYTLKLGWQAHLIEPQPGLPDLVFTANGGLVIGGQVALPRFRHPERQGETPVFKPRFLNNGFKTLPIQAHDCEGEGEGDAVLWNDVPFAGYPWRSDRLSHQAVARALGVNAVSLQLTDDRFYHLDTALTLVNRSTVALYASTPTRESVDKVRRVVPNVVLASEDDALAYRLNALIDGEHIVLSDRATGLADMYRRMGLQVWPTPIDEFQKSGGGVKCLSLELRH
ncbi:MAG: hypothetical protein LH480_10260 [Rubrivivax sp.]|nr:hypothetical protein [Rubrivivax sp.]